MWLLGGLLLLATPVFIGGPRAVCATACSDEGHDDDCAANCSQPCCSVIASTIDAPVAQLQPRQRPQSFPPPASLALPPSPDPAEILLVPKSALV